LRVTFEKAVVVIQAGCGRGAKKFRELRQHTQISGEV